jgi:hypothetical protein
MPAFNFQRRFADAVRSGAKRQTIRARRKHPPRVGQIAYLYVGMRATGTEKLGEAPIWRVRSVLIQDGRVYVEGKLLEGVDLLSFAQADGFANVNEFRLFFGHNFDGHCVEWRPA